jgi:hypothetical protein
MKIISRTSSTSISGVTLIFGVDIGSFPSVFLDHTDDRMFRVT